MELTLACLGWAMALATLPGTLELAVLTVAGLWPPGRPERRAGARRGRWAVVVPAHNEEKTIRATLLSLRECRFLKEARDEIVVVADNCDDATASVSKEAGARVLVRDDAARRGKGYALDYAFKTLLREDFAAYVVIDADTIVADGFLNAMHREFLEGADAVQARYAVLDPGISIRTRLMNVALFAMNVLRPRGRHNLGLSAGITGNGFGLSRDCLEAVPYRARSIAEDLEYHLLLVRAGKKVRFADGAVVRSRMPAHAAGYRTQRARWEGGRLRLALRQAPRLLSDLCRGSGRALEPLFDLLTLPLALHVLLLLPLCFIRGFAGCGVAGLLVVAGHVLAAIAIGGGTWRDVLVLLYAPAYIVLKVALLPKIVGASRPGAPWIRTERSV